jgi:hypothetical protein
LADVANHRLPLPGSKKNWGTGIHGPFIVPLQIATVADTFATQYGVQLMYRAFQECDGFLFLKTKMKNVFGGGRKNQTTETWFCLQSV